MTSRILLIGILSASAGWVNAQNKEIRFYGHEDMEIRGSAFDAEEKESPFDRLPVDLKSEVRDPVWRLSKNSAGLSVLFETNSSEIHARWEVLEDRVMNHMAPTGIKGVDLYLWEEGQWRYVNTGRPVAKKSESLLIGGMSPEMRKYQLVLPLYDGVIQLEIGVDVQAEFRPPLFNLKKPLVFYGTSITQGGCASRPGMAHTNIISRRLDREVINLGFSGNGRMETEIAEVLAGIDARMFVIECLPNMTTEQVTERVAPLVQVIRSRRPQTPIVFVETMLYESGVLNSNLLESQIKKNEALKSEFEKLVSSGMENIHFIEHKNAIGPDHEGTVDGVHFTDLGFLRYAEYLLAQFKIRNLL